MNSGNGCEFNFKIIQNDDNNIIRFVFAFLEAFPEAAFVQSLYVIMNVCSLLCGNCEMI